jgi:hypothetical protein
MLVFLKVLSEAERFLAEPALKLLHIVFLEVTL